MALYTQCIPSLFHQHINDIDYSKLLKQGKTTLFFDLDNTIMSYDEHDLSQDMVSLLKKLEETFKIIIVSNSGFKRVSRACKPHHLPFVHSARKPFKSGFKKALKLASAHKDVSVFVGDQLMTDILGANRLGITSILIYPLKKRSDHVFTRINRRIEKYMIRKIKKNNVESYNRILKAYVETNKL